MCYNAPHEYRNHRFQAASRDGMPLQECIGRGAVEEVYRGNWRGIDVAIRTVKGAWMSIEEIETKLDHEASAL